MREFDGFEAHDIGADDSDELDHEKLNAAVRELSLLQQQQTANERRITALKKRLKPIVQIEGEPDEKGNLLLPLTEVCGDIETLQLQRRVTDTLDPDLAERMLKAIKVGDATLWDQCVETVEVLDDSKVMAAKIEGYLTDAEIDAMYPKVESFAFSPIRVKKTRR